jgi:hypothetical protein
MRDIEKEFNMVIEQYKMSPFGFRLRKTGCILKLIEYNGLLYIDNDNLYKIVNELLGPNIPKEIQDYLPKITFSEIISLETDTYKDSHRLTCIQFIDYSFFNKCEQWLRDRNSCLDEFIDNRMYGNTPMSMCEGKFQFNFLDDKDLEIEGMAPFKDLWGFEGINVQDEEFNGSGYYRESILSRPRGKQMCLTKENLKERPFVCTVPLCERAFKRYEHLKRHMKMHTGDRPYKCCFPGCKKSFSRSDNLSQHMKTHSLEIGKKKRINFKSLEKNLEFL